MSVGAAVPSAFGSTMPDRRYDEIQRKRWECMDPGLANATFTLSLSLDGIGL